MGLTADTLWGLCHREFRALERQWTRTIERQDRILATIRADLHNTSAKSYDRHFEAEDFLEGKAQNVESRVQELIAQGYAPAAAAAIVMSKQSQAQKLVVLDEMERRSHKQKQQRRA